jgi:signal transduction histidine kinase/CheY-like chemotaxis protein
MESIRVMRDRGELLKALRAFRQGDFTVRMPRNLPGVEGEIAQVFNDLVELEQAKAAQIARIADQFGKEGQIGERMDVPGAVGGWTGVIESMNKMIRSLKDTARKNTEQDWLKTHLARFTRMLQGQRDLVAVSRLILSELTPLVNAQQAAFYVADHRGGEPLLELLAGYAQRSSKSLPRSIAFGEGLVGQCALEKKRIVLRAAPNDYIRISSSLGEGAPVNIVILPVLFEGEVKAVIELASFSRFSDIHQSFLDQLTESIGVVLNTIAVNMQTEYLLHQSQSLTAELQAKQDQLRAANDALEDKAEQLSLSSRYKSEFLANMSHELRTPLNSLLILARLLADNVGGNLSPKQVEFARTIHASGAELLALINDILDLAKIESGTVTLSIGHESFDGVRKYAERTFRQVAADKGLGFPVSLDPKLPATMETDGKRLQQIVTNLLSNAFKFTSKGTVSLRVENAASGWLPGHPVLDAAEAVVAFAVADTGIGIPPGEQRRIFEAFQQADGTDSREFGGTGLGLSISRELARLLGGEIRVRSVAGEGSTFTLYLPLAYRQTADAPQHVLLDRRLTDPAPMEEEPTLPPALDAGRNLARPLADLAGRKVLVVDDDIRNVFALTSALEAHGMKVIHADSGKEGIELLRGTRGVDAVLMDVMMPGLDGLDALRFVRQIEGYRRLPIIAVTAKAMIGDREKCLAAGANDYVAKPVNIDALLATLSRQLNPD